MNSSEHSELEQSLCDASIIDWESVDIESYLEDYLLSTDFKFSNNETDQTHITLSSATEAVAIVEKEPILPVDIPTDQREWLIYDSSTNRFRPPLLFEFIIILLQKPQYQNLAHYTDVKNGLFVIEQPHVIAELWQNVRNRQSRQPMTYDKFARAMRWYYTRDVFIKTNTRYTFQLSQSILDRYCYDRFGRRTEIPEIQQNLTTFQLTSV